MKRSSRALLGTSKLSVFPAGRVATTVSAFVGEAVQRRSDEPSVVLELRGGGDQQDGAGDLLEPGRRFQRGVPVTGADHNDAGGPVAARVFERLGGQIEEEPRTAVDIVGGLKSGKAHLGADGVE